MFFFVAKKIRVLLPRFEQRNLSRLDLNQHLCVIITIRLLRSCNSNRQKTLSISFATILHFAEYSTKIHQTKCELLLIRENQKNMREH